MDFFEILGKMMVILVAMAAGFFGNRMGYLGGETDQKLCKLILNITMPLMIVATVIGGDSMGDLTAILAILKVSVVFYAMAFAFALLLPRLIGGTATEKGVWRFTMSFSNVGFIGYPVAVALFGPSALFYAAILALPFNLLSFTLGPLMLVGRSRFQWKKMFSPCVVASLIGLVCALAGIHAPELITAPMAFVGDVTVPLSLLVVGSLLAGLPARQMVPSPRILAVTVLRLLVMPAVLFVLLQPMKLSPMILGIAVTQMAMPTAINGTLMSMEYGGDTETLAQVTFLTTVASLVTIPLIAALLL